MGILFMIISALNYSTSGVWVAILGDCGLDTVMLSFTRLLFVVLIIASNIFGSLSMLSIAKREDMETLRALGANERLVRRIFVFEGWLVSLCGLAVGLVVGVALTLVQQHFGIIKMPGGFLLQAYPVVLQAGDVLWTVLGVAAVGMLISLLAAPKATSSQSPAPGRDPR